MLQLRLLLLAAACATALSPRPDALPRLASPPSPAASPPPLPAASPAASLPPASRRLQALPSPAAFLITTALAGVNSSTYSAYYTNGASGSVLRALVNMPSAIATFPGGFYFSDVAPLAPGDPLNCSSQPVTTLNLPIVDLNPSTCCLAPSRCPHRIRRVAYAAGNASDTASYAVMNWAGTGLCNASSFVDGNAGYLTSLCEPFSIAVAPPAVAGAAETLYFVSAVHRAVRRLRCTGTGIASCLVTTVWCVVGWAGLVVGRGVASWAPGARRG